MHPRPRWLRLRRLALGRSAPEGARGLPRQSRSPPGDVAQGPATSCCRPRHCTAIPSTATPWVSRGDRPGAPHGQETRRVHVGKAYCGQTHQQKFRVWILRHVTAAIRREIVHPKVEHRMDRISRDLRVNAVPRRRWLYFGLLLRYSASVSMPSSGCLAETARRDRLNPRTGAALQGRLINAKVSAQRSS